MIFIEGVIFWITIIIAIKILSSTMDKIFDFLTNNNILGEIIKNLFNLSKKVYARIDKPAQNLFNKYTFWDKKSNYLLSLIIIGCTILSLTYYDFLNLYFQGDEWYFFSYYLPFTKTWTGTFFSAYHSIVGGEFMGPHMTPISNLAFAISLKLFGMNFILYALSSLLIHLINSILIAKIIWKILPKYRIIGWIASLFYLSTYTHQEAITWVAAYLFTLISVTFILLSTYYLIKIIQGDASNKNVILFVLFFLYSMLSKESTVIFFPIYFILIFSLSIQRKQFITKALTLVFGIFITFRFILPQILLHVFNQKNIVDTSAALDLPLMTFRLITYPLKLIPQLFIPRNFIQTTAESLTPFAYPHYGLEKEVRGTNFLTFTQTAGSDIFLYFFAALFILLFVELYRYYSNNRQLKNLLLIAILLIILSPMPLLLIASFAPWAAYVTFFDSRHLYLSNLGAAIVFALTAFAILNKLKDSKMLFKLKLPTKFTQPFLEDRFKPHVIFVFILLLWFMVNRHYLILDLKHQSNIAEGRKIIINEILNSQPTLPEKSIFYIDSDSAYYGFAELMPPFQTNFGQALAAIYFQRDQLPKEVLNFDFLKKGIVSQGYEEFNGKGFGYFLSLYKVVQVLEDKNLPLDTVFSYKWEGKNNKIYNNTNEIRNKIKEIQTERAKYSDWKKVSFPAHNLTVRIPPNTAVKELTPENKDILQDLNIIALDFNINLKIRVKNNGVGIDPNVKPLNDSEGNTIGENFSYRYINMNDGTTLTTTITTTGNSIKYFFPTNLPPDKIIELTVIGHPSKSEEFPLLAEKFISFIQFPDNIQQ